MDDQNTTPTPATNSEATEATAKLYATKVEAEAAKPADAPKSLKPMEVSKNGTVVGWVLCRGYDHGLAQVARTEGYSLSTGVKAAVITVEAAAATLASLDDAALAALGLSRKPQKGKK